MAIWNCATEPPSGVERMKSSHWRQSDASMTRDPATIADVTPSAIPSWRHSRRTANQVRAIAGVTLVNATNAHAQG
jgi:hypothetical protein